MNKKLLSLLMVFCSLIGVALTTQKTFAANSASEITINGESYTNFIIDYDGNGNYGYTVYLDGVAYPGGLIGLIDDYADSFTNPNIDYGLEIKGAANQPITITGTGSVNRVHINYDGTKIDIYLDGVKYSGGLSTYIDDFATEISNPYAVYAIMISSNLRPVISGQETFVTSVDDPKPLSFFQGYLTAIDETDGNITNNIYVVSDNYTTNKSILGTYTVVFGVKDSANNESTLEVKISVVDVTKPVITGNSSKVQISYTQTWNVENFRSTLTVSDNYATMNNSHIVVKTDGYTSNKTNLGTYNVVFSATDPSGNETTFTKQVEVIDDIAPVFSGPTVLTKPSTSILSVNEIKAQLTATDAKEGNKTSQITVFEDNYTGNGNRVGNYTITFQVSDSKGNRATHVVTVSVQDNIPPVWYIQDGVSFKLVQPATLTRQQIINLLVATGQLNVSATTQINFLVDEYSGNETTPGVYTVSIGYSNTAGNEGVHTIAITVLDQEDSNPIVVNPDKTILDNIVEFISSPTGIVTIVAVAGLGFILIATNNKKTYRRKK
ncbi:hypothetical protein [Acholeplasma hippikon]|uniref:HYR domain n=1 Tax=Acholeplasma hippikon TaxID=264636 RepID=A0A449BL36_9MOLU|nr:hypothetical protein [Acholeplasma hippikon]VEU83144.1 Uncharacterised protein [Acholeplasma hippikon]